MLLAFISGFVAEESRTSAPAGSRAVSRCLTRPPAWAAGTCQQQMVAPAVLLAGVPDQSHLPTEQAAVPQRPSSRGSVHQQHFDQSSWELAGGEAAPAPAAEAAQGDAAPRTPW